MDCKLDKPLPAQAYLAAIIASAEDAIVSKSLDGTIQTWNAGAEQLYGYSAAEIIGKPFRVLVPPDRASEVERLIRRLQQGERIEPFETVRVRRDGRQIDVSVSYSPIRDETGQLIGTAAIARDISERKRIERYRSVRLAVTQILAQSSSLEEAAGGILQAVCESLNWSLGALWLVDPARNQIACFAIWRLPSAGVERFVEATRSSVYPPGESLPGRVWASGQPHWIADIGAEPYFVRREVAADEGLHGGFACPIFLEGQVLGVVEFYSHEIREPDVDLLEMMTTIGGQIGQFLKRKRAEQRLRESEKELADFFNNAAVGLHWVGPDGVLLRANRAELEMLGYTADEYVGRHFSEFYADPDSAEDVLRRLQSGEELRDYETRLRCKDGSIRHVLVDSNVLWEHGRFVHTRCFTRDISEQKRAELALRESEERFRGIFLQTSVGIAQVDLQGRFVKVNQRYCEIVGRSEEELYRLCLYDITHPDDVPLNQQLLMQLLENGSPFVLEKRYVRPDGSPVWVHNNVSALRDDRGRITSVFAVTVEISQRKRAEAALRESEHQLQLVLDHAPVLIARCDRQARFRFVNRRYAARLNLRPEEFVGRSISEMLGQQAYEAIRPYVERVLAGQRIQFEVEVPYERIGRRIMHCLYEPEQDAQGEVVGWVSVVTDVTERRRADRKLQMQARVLESMVEGVSIADEDGVILYTNAAEDRMFGYEPQELIGQHLAVLNTYPPEENQRIVREVIAQLRTEGSWYGEIENRKKDGTPFTTYARINSLELDGRKYWVCVQEDITEQTRARLALEESEERFRQLAENIRGVFWMADPHKPGILYISSSYEQVWGRTCQSLYERPRSFIEAIHPEDQPRVIDSLRRQVGGETTVEEYRVLHPDGAVRWVRDRGFPIRDESGRVYRVAGLAEDITEQKLAQEALEQSEEKFRQLAENVHDIFWLGEPNERRVVYVSPAYEGVWGRKREDLYADFMQWLDSIHPEDRGRVEEAFFRNVLQGGYNEQYRIVRPDGSIRWIRDRGFPIRESSGEVRRVVGVAEDITERKLAEFELRSNKERLELAQEGARVGVFEWSPFTGEVTWNEMAERLYGLSSGGFSGRYEDWLELVHPEDRDRADTALRQAVHGRADLDTEFRVVWPDGTVRWLAAKGRVFCDDEAQPARMLGINLDITDRKQSEAALRQSEERLRLALEAGRMGTWEWYLPTNQVIWSPSLEAIHGLQPGTFPGTFEAYQQDIHPDDRERVLSSISRTVEQGCDHHLEYRLVWPDGSVHWVEARGKLFRDASGRPIRMVGVCIDIEERKRLEQELHRRVGELAEAEIRIRSVVDNVIDGIVTIDERGSIQSFNPAAEQIFGYSASEVIGQNIRRLMPEPYYSQYDRDMADYLRTGKARGVGIGREVTGQRKDGSLFPLDLAVSEFRIGHERFYTGIVRDITERKRVERGLRLLADASAALAEVGDYEAVLQRIAQLAVPEFADWCVVYLVEPHGALRQLAVAHVNPAKVELAYELNRRYPPQPDMPYGAYHVLRTRRSEMMAVIPEDVLAEVARDAQHEEILKELGLKSYMCVPLRTRDKMLGVLTFVTAESARSYTEADLTFAEELARRAAIALENAQLYADLREADRMKDEFLAMLAHELRNPLAPIRNALHILKMPTVDSNLVAQARDMAERQVQHMARLLDDLLDVSRISRGRIELRKEIVDLVSIVERTAEAARSFIDERGHRLTLTVPPEAMRVLGDPTRLEQILTNLLNNAAKYTDPGGQIGLSLEQVGADAVLRVRDTGIGIAPEMLPRIFELFVQAERRLDRSQGGVGIGLTLVKRLVELHGGAIEVYSDGVGRGSEFIVRLPVITMLGVGSESTKGQSAVSTPVAPQRILVVDDNQDAANTLAMFLKLLGQDVQTAYSGPEALEVVRTRRPDLVLLDLGMPGMDGYEVAQRLRQQPGCEQVQLVALTGWGQEEDRRRTQEAGFDQHLVKPVEPSAIAELLARWAGRVR